MARRAHNMPRPIVWGQPWLWPVCPAAVVWTLCFIGLALYSHNALATLVTQRQLGQRTARLRGLCHWSSDASRHQRSATCGTRAELWKLFLPHRSTDRIQIQTYRTVQLGKTSPFFVFAEEQIKGRHHHGLEDTLNKFQPDCMFFAIQVCRPTFTASLKQK